MFTCSANKKGWYTVMETINSYYGAAQNDLLYIRTMYSTIENAPSFNIFVVMCATTAERFLKAVIEKCFVEDSEAMSLLHTHNLRSLYNKIITSYSLSTDSKSCKWLGDFYFDARYPGDNFVVVNKDDAIEAYQILEMIYSDVTRILQDEEQIRKDALKELQSFKAF